MQVEAAAPNQHVQQQLLPLNQNIVVQNIRGNERRDRINNLINLINGNPFNQHIEKIAALKKLTNFELRNINFTHDGNDYLVTSGTWCNVYQTRQNLRTILLRSGCRPQAYLDSITTCMVDSMNIRIYSSIEDLSTLLKTIEALNYKSSIGQRRMTTESNPVTIQMVMNYRHYETDFSWTTRRTLYLTTITYTQDENLQVQGNIDNWKDHSNKQNQHQTNHKSWPNYRERSRERK